MKPILYPSFPFSVTRKQIYDSNRYNVTNNFLFTYEHGTFDLTLLLTSQGKFCHFAATFPEVLQFPFR